MRLDHSALPDLRYANVEGKGQKHRQVQGESLKVVICWAWGTTVARTDWRASLPGGEYNMILPGPEDTRYTTLEAFAQAFHEAFHLKIYAKEEDRLVLVLKAPGGRAPSALTPSDPGEDQYRATNSVGFIFKGYTTGKFTDWVEAQWEGKPVINETNLTGKYNFVLKGNFILESGSMPDYLHDLGFEEVTETRRIPVVVVEKE